MQPAQSSFPSTAFTTFFAELAAAGICNPEVILTKGTRRQLVEGMVVNIPTYNITYAGLGGEVGGSLTIGELIIDDAAAFYLYVDDEYEMEPDGLASSEQYETALNTFQTSYLANREFNANRAAQAKSYFEKVYPQYKI